MNTPKISTLSNGLRVATDTMPEAFSVNLGFYLDVGARHEQAHENGLTHLLEHMVFKGTHSRDVRAINKAIDDVGGSLGAYTARDEVSYYAQVLPENIALALDLISDMMFEPKFDADDLEKEKSVIAQEIGESLDAPDDHIFDLLQDKAWPDQPLGRPILGTVETLKPVTPEQLRSYFNRFLKAESCVLVAAGAVDHERFVREAETYFSRLAAGKADPHLPARYIGGSALAVRDQQEQMHLCYGLEGVGVHHPDYYAQGIFATILGGGVSSRLYHEVREERGLAYSVGAGQSPYADTALLSIYAACDPARAREASAVILDETRRLVETLTEEEFKRAKAMIRAGILMGSEDSDERSSRLAAQLLTHQRIIPLEEGLQRYADVTLQNVRDYAQRLLASPLSRAAVGADRTLDPFDTDRRRLQTG